MDIEHTKIFDCTIRDGGLVNRWNFTEEFVNDLYESLNSAGVEYMEIGYKNSPKLHNDDQAGPWRCLDDKMLQHLLQKKQTQLAALIDVAHADASEILPREKSLIDLMRITCNITDIHQAVKLVDAIHTKGYDTALNIIALSTVADHDLDQALPIIAKCPADVVYVVDTYGSLYPQDIEHFVTKFRNALPHKQIGVHTHNNLQLAFANTLAAVDSGATFLDASVYGMGRAAGNCPTELLIHRLPKSRYQPRPLIHFIERRMIALREQVEWGYALPFTITGQFNAHPLAAEELLKGSEPEQLTPFYDRLSSSQH